MPRIFSIEGSYAHYASSISYLGEVVTDMKRFAREPESFDVVLFTGGEDVHHGIYGQRHYSGRGSDYFQRDMKEAYVYQVAKRFGIPMAGICRGLQFTASMAGACLVQDFSGHGCSHNSVPIYAEYPSGKTGLITGLCMHHQMVDCNTLTKDMKVVGHVAGEEIGRYNSRYLSDNGKKIGQKMEIEAIFCKDPMFFGVQYHPESMEPGTSGRKFFCEWVEYMLALRSESTGEVKYSVANG